MTDTEFVYGKSNETSFAGRLKQRTDSSGAVEFEYGRLGETTKETKKLISKMFADGGDNLTAHGKQQFIIHMMRITSEQANIMRGINLNI